jgi:hypothetical protein
LTITSFPPFSNVLKGIFAAGVTLRLLPIAKCKSAAYECPKPKSKSFSLKFYKVLEIINNLIEIDDSINKISFA